MFREGAGMSVHVCYAQSLSMFKKQAFSCARSVSFFSVSISILLGKILLTPKPLVHLLQSQPPASPGAHLRCKFQGLDSF